MNVVREIEQMPWAGIEILGFFDDKVDEENLDQVMGKPILGNIAGIKSVSQQE